jgi:Flp pilus assembly pilin Flp
MKNWMKSRWLRVVNNQWGASAVEYALLVSAIAVTIIGVVYLLGGRIQGIFGRIANVLR